MEHVPGMHDEIDLALEDGVDRRLERPLDIDRALVAPGLGVGAAERAVAEVGIGKVRDPQRG